MDKKNSRLRKVESELTAKGLRNATGYWKNILLVAENEFFRG